MRQSGWQWYYRKYIDVKKGGVGGVGMLLAGYCILSYIWSYPHMSKCAADACIHRSGFEVGLCCFQSAIAGGSSTEEEVC